MPVVLDLAAALLAELLASRLRDATEPVFYFIAGGVALGTAFMSAREWPATTRTGPERSAGDQCSGPSAEPP